MDRPRESEPSQLTVVPEIDARSTSFSFSPSRRCSSIASQRELAERLAGLACFLADESNTRGGKSTTAIFAGSAGLASGAGLTTGSGAGTADGAGLRWRH